MLYKSKHSFSLFPPHGIIGERLGAVMTKDTDTGGLRLRGAGDIARLEKDFLAEYEKHTGALFFHVLIRVRDRDRALDVTQEAFTRTWEYLAKGKEVAHVKAFLYRTANNIIVDEARKRRADSLDAMMEESGFEPADTDTRAPIDSPALRQAYKILDSLDETYRTVITMRYLDGLLPKEIASILGLSENVVSVRIHRALERLRRSVDV